MKAIIMAGGKGTRLMPLTNSIPKPMVNIIDKPVLEYVINLCKNHGITEIGITLGYLPDVIVDYFGDGKKFGVNITYFFEDEPLGTAGGVKNAEGYLGEDFVVLSGDAYSEIDLTRAIEFHKQKESLFTIVATPHPNPVGYGIIELDFENRIKKFVEKPQVVYPSLINTGIYVMKKTVLNFIPDGFYDFGKDLLPRLTDVAYAIVDYNYWSDIGTLASYYQTNLALVTK